MFKRQYLFPPIQGVLQVQYQNLGSVETDGIEFESKTAFSDNFSASIGVSLNDGKEDDDYLNSLSPDHAKIALSWISDNGKFRWNTSSTLMESSRSNLSPVCGRSGQCLPAQAAPGRVTLDTYLSFDITPKLNFKFGVRNLTNVKYWDYPTIAGQAAGTADEYLMPGTNTNFSVRYSL